MPTFKFTSPEGKTYSVVGPEGATQEKAWEMLRSQLPETPPPATALSARGRAARPITTLAKAPGAILGAGTELAQRAFETSRRMAEGDPTVSAGPTFEAALLGLGGAPRVGGGGRLPT